MKDELTEEQTHAILEALDNAIKTGPWGESNFLRVIGKNLQEIRDNFANRLSASSLDESSSDINPANRIKLGPGQQEVFISLYSSEGSNLQSWERLIANLSRQVISRPIYSDEEAIKFLIKSKENKINEAYVAIYINQADILVMSQEKMPKDKFGKPLMSLKDRAISLNNITRFVHFSGTYHYYKGRLVKSIQT